MKKLFLLTTFAFFVVVIFAQTEADFNVALTADGTGAIITGYNGRNTSIRIPATIQGMPVREIGPEAFWQGNHSSNYTFSSVIIPQGVTKIGKGAFKGVDVYDRTVSKLTSITLPEGLLEIGDYAFYGCPLTTVTLPQSLTTIGSSAFSRTAITSLLLPGSLTRTSDSVFAGCKNLRTVTISEGITQIPSLFMGMFAGCTALTNVSLPPTLTRIGMRTFTSCTSLTTITLPIAITGIGDEAFRDCTALTTIIIPETVEKIAISGSAFSGCPKVNLASQAALRRVGFAGSF